MKYQKKKFERPLKPWSAGRIASETKLLQDYGLRRVHEIWRAEAKLRDFRRLARELAATKDKAAEAVLLTKLTKLGLIRPGATLDDVLALTVESVFGRRLQTIVNRKGLATTPLQARQFIVHGHVAIDGRRVRWPSTLVTVDEEGKIGLYDKSKLKGAVKGA